MPSPPWLRWLLTVCAVVVLWLYAVDMAVYDLFSFRLRMADLLKYAGDFSSNATVALPYLARGRGLLLVVITLVLFYLYLKLQPESPVGNAR